jgi:polyhydroxyalkanoate synthesis repressor PhaR
MTDPVLLKKYANRRLYDTRSSQYVTLAEVADMIRGGQEVRVLDAKTKEDVTAFILTQIILESAKQRNVLLPVPLLHLIIQYGETVLVEFFDKYLEQTLRNFLEHKSAADDQFKQWLEMGAEITSMAQKTLTELEPFKHMFDPFTATHKKKEK